MTIILWCICVWILAFLISNNDGYIALFVTLGIMSGLVAYRYHAGDKNNLAAAIAIVTAYVLRGRGKSLPVQWTIYIVLMYWLSSFIEWVSHKYIMHGYQYWPWLDKVHTTFPPLVEMQRSCKSHHTHHLSINKDMTVDKEKMGDEYELFFPWKISLILIIVALPGAFCLATIMHLGVPSWIVAPVITIAFVLLFSFIWNTIHPRMHDYEVQLGITDGVPAHPKWASSKEGLYHRNHEAHHQVKGPQKGNFNVVFLGMDEIMGTNRL
jgi:hypothetical protein